MKALFVSTSYPLNDSDWRGTFIANMITSLSRIEGISFRVWAPPGDLPASVAYAASPSEAAWLGNIMTRGGIAHVFREKRTGAAGAVMQLLRHLRRLYRRESDVDFVHVNWLQNALPLWGISKPLVVGILGSDFQMLRVPGMKPLLRKVLGQRRSILAPNAQWMAPLLERIFGNVAEIRPIPFGVDDRWFQVRREPPVESPRRWISVLRLTRKKIGPLFEWGEGLFTNGRELHLFGPMMEKVDLPRWVNYHGPVRPQDLLTTWFPSAHGLVTLSQHSEGRPQVLLEAMASGLPAIVSDIPAHRDVIHHERTGWLARNSDDFRQGILFLNKWENGAAIGAEARSWMRKNIGTWDDCARRYVEAYTSLMEGSR